MEVGENTYKFANRFVSFFTSYAVIAVRIVPLILLHQAYQRIGFWQQHWIALTLSATLSR